MQLKDSFADILEKQPMWQNRNKYGATAGGVDLVNYSELHHPMSHHNIAIGNDRLTSFPTDLVGARTDAKLVRHGYYAKEALQVTNSLGKTAQDFEAIQKQPKMLNALDPRIEKHYDMLGQANNTVPVNYELLDDIEYAN